MRQLLLLLAALGLGFGVAHTQTIGNKVTISVENYPADTILIAHHLGEQQYVDDTLNVKNGKAVWENPEGKIGGVYLVVLRPKNNYVEFILNEEEFELSFDANDANATLSSKGSRENEVFYDYMAKAAEVGAEIMEKRKAFDPLNEKKQKKEELTPKEQKQYDKLIEELQALNQKVTDYRLDVVENYKDELFVGRLLGMMSEPELPDELKDADRLTKYTWYKNKYMNVIDFSDPRFLRTPVYQGRLDRFFDQVVVQHPDSINKEADKILNEAKKDSAMFQYNLVKILNKYIESNIMGMDAVYIHLIQKYYSQKDLTHWVEDDKRAEMIERANAMEGTLIGKTAPDFTLVGVDRQFYTLSNIDADYTIMFIYDPGCGHCKKSAPGMVEVANKYKDLGVAFVAVSATPDPEKWEEFIEKYEFEGHYNLTNLYGRSDYKTKYDLQSTPQIFVLDADKTIIAKKLSADQIDSFLARKMGLEESPNDQTDSEADKIKQDGQSHSPQNHE